MRKPDLVTIGTVITIAGAHKLYNDKKPLNWNLEEFGKCSQWHGHNWTIDISVSGVVNRENGMLINFNKIKEIVYRLDHTSLNDTLKLPTAENLAKYLAKKILRSQSNIMQVAVTVWESDKSSATYVAQYE